MPTRIVRRVHPGALVLIVATACVHSHSASPEPFYCMAPPPSYDSPPVAWLTPGSDSREYGSISPATVTRMLTGTWEVVSVVTEGSAPGPAGRWKLRLVPTDLNATPPCARGLCGFVRSNVVAAGAALRTGAVFDSAAAAERRSIDANRIEAQYDSTHNQLTLAFGPPILDSGIFFAVNDASDTALTGRLINGSNLVFAVRRGDVTILETNGGYFCARKVVP